MLSRIPRTFVPAPSARNTFPLQTVPHPAPNPRLPIGLHFFNVYVALLLLVSFPFFVSGNARRFLFGTTAGDVFCDSLSGSPSRGHLGGSHRPSTESSVPLCRLRGVPFPVSSSS